MIRFGRKCPQYSWQPQEYEESACNPVNPSRGWYRLYSHSLAETVEYAQMETVLCEEEKLVLLQLYIGDYKSVDLPGEALDACRQILDFYWKHGKDMMIRVVYDRDGHGLEHEPFALSRIQQHMIQLGVIFRAYARAIYLLQGLFVGSWGEMHDSKFLDEKSLRCLYMTMREATGGTCRIAVRTPAQRRQLCEGENLELALFNDGLLASDTDLGTYAQQNMPEREWTQSWGREAEIDYLNTACEGVPNGGEVVSLGEAQNLESVVDYFSRIHVSYLHSVYDGKVLDRWRERSCNIPGAFQGKSEYAYIGAHLGYRFLIKDTLWKRTRKGAQLELTIENRGFANIYDKVNATLCMDSGEWTREIELDKIELEKINSGKSMQYSIIIPEEILDRTDIRIRISLARANDGQIIRLVNQGADDSFTLGILTWL